MHFPTRRTGYLLMGLIVGIALAAWYYETVVADQYRARVRLLERQHDQLERTVKRLMDTERWKVGNND